MKILHLQSDTGEVGGISNYIKELIAYQYSECIYHINVSKINEVTINKYKNCTLHTLPTTYTIYSIFSFIYRLRKILSSNEINIIHSHALRSGFIGIIIKLIYPCKVVHTNHGIRFFQKKNLFNKLIFLIFEIFVIIFSDKYVCITKSNFNFIIKFFNLSKITLINTRLNVLSTYDRQKKINKFICTGIGSMIPVKRIDNFIHIAKEISKLLPIASFEWFGSGPDFQYFRNLADFNNINIKWHGNKDYSELINNLSESSILLVTSDYEVLPLCILEAYAKGVLVISNNFNYSDDFIINYDTGIIVDTNDSIKAAKIIHNILLNFNEYSQLLNNAKLYYEKNHYDSKIMSDEYFDIYKSLCLQY